MKAFFNDKIQNEKEIFVSPFCSGFQFGIGVFTTVRILNYEIQFLDEHIARLKQSCLYFQMNFPEIDLRSIAKQLCLENKIKNARGKIIFWEHNSNVNVLFKVEELCLNKNPKNVIYSKDGRFYSPFFTMKTLQYAFPILENRKKEADDILYYNAEGYLLETIFCNIFVKIDGVWCTPSFDVNILSGIMRQKVIEKFHKHKIPIVERKIHKNEKIMSAFTTNCVHGIVSIQKLNHRNLEISLPFDSL
jgi:branched-subunit amino acid aminotransferase/4-amino-4-deoxychorismate lyase